MICNSIVDSDVLSDLNEKTKHLFPPMNTLPKDTIIYEDFMKMFQTKIAFSEILKQTKINRKAYVDLLGLAKTFDTYPAIAWPVTYESGKSNIALFKTVKSKKRHPPGPTSGPTPGPTSSLLGADVAIALNRVADAVDLISLANATQKLIPASPPDGTKTGV
jgi:hypothetical protein